MPINELMAFLLAFIVSFIRTIEEFIKDKKFGWQLYVWAVLSIATCIFGIMAINDKNKADNNLSQKIDNVTYVDRSAIITSCQNGANPQMFSDNRKDTIAISIEICNLGNGIAYNIEDKIEVIYMVGDTIYHDPSNISPAFNKNMIIAKNESYIMLGGIVTKKYHAPGERYFYCVKISYSDSVNSSKQWIGVFETTGFPLNQTLATPHSKDFYKIENYLLDNKIW